MNEEQNTKINRSIITVTYEADSFTKICLVMYFLNLMAVLLEYYLNEYLLLGF